MEAKQKKIPGRMRWYICAIVTGLMTLVQANVHVYNFTVLCMQEEQEKANNGELFQVSNNLI